MLIALLVLTLTLSGLFLWAAGGIQRPRHFEGEIVDQAPVVGLPAAPATEKLTIMTWNMAYARGPNPDNTRNDPDPKEVVERRLKEMGALIRSKKVDVLLLQEVDFDAARSHRIDQIAKLAEASGLRYTARAVTWRANYVPYPYWPPSRHYGRVLSGGAVLSRYPIRANLVTLHPKPKRHAWYYNLFYLFRFTQRVRLAVGQKQLWVVNNHLEAFDKENRAEQAQALVGLLHALPTEDPLLVVGGDLNTTPPEAQKKHGFPDEPEDDYREDETLPILRKLSALRELVTPEEYRANEGAFFTFPSEAPTRRLDYLFASTRAAVLRREFPATRDFSDHRPVIAELKLP